MHSVEGPVVITGAGRAFSAGVDLRALADGGTDYAGRFLAALSEALLAIYDHPAPVVAAINGHAIAGGCVLAMCADVRLMSGGTIGLTELAVGVPFPVAALEICRYSMGISAPRPALTAKTVCADTALAVARELDQSSPAAYAATKKQSHRPVRTAINDGVAADADVPASWISEE